MLLSRKLVILFWVIWTIPAILQFVLPKAFPVSNFYHAFVLLLTLVSIFTWYKTDARERGFQPHKILDALVILLPPLGVIVYKLRASGIKGTLIFLGWCTLLFSVYVAFTFALVWCIDVSVGLNL